MPKFQFDPAFLYARDSSHQGITQEIQDQTASDIERVRSNIHEKIATGAFPFISVTNDHQMIEDIEQVFPEIGWAKYLVVVGIGGSDLGGRAIQNALSQDKPPLQVFFHGDSTDPEQIRRLLGKIELKQTVFCIISKSGQTVEVISQYAFWKQQFIEAGFDDWQKRFLFITDPEKGVLREEARQHGVATLVIPEGVGGRFSVLTPVGLLPAKAMGVAIPELLEGAQAVINDSALLDQAFQFAATQFQLTKCNLHLVAIMPYAVQLEELARWFRQLWAESLGKDDKGILPIQARGPADQHSQVQFYNQGRLMQSLLFIRVEEVLQDFEIGPTDISAAAYLQGKSFHHIRNIEQEATALALFKQGRPSATIHLEKVDAWHLGALFMFFEIAVVMLAELLAVNAFDQPGVEEGKQYIYSLLGKEGFEEKKQEIEKLKANATD